MIRDAVELVLLIILIMLIRLLPSVSLPKALKRRTVQDLQISSLPVNVEHESTYGSVGCGAPMTKEKEEQSVASASDEEAGKESNKEPSKGPRELIKGTFIQERIMIENSEAARLLQEKSCFGWLEKNRITLTLIEAFYLIQKEKLQVLDGKSKPFSEEAFLKKAVKLEPQFWVKYCVFRDLRNRGYIVKTALKFGADFRVYDRGIKPGEDHAKWIVYPVHEGSTLTWHDFSAKNRVAHSTKKRLLIGIVDEESDVTYYSISWIRP